MEMAADLVVVDQRGVPIDGVLDDEIAARRPGRLTMTRRWNMDFFHALGVERAWVTVTRRGYVTVPEFLPAPAVSLGQVVLEPARGLSITVVDQQGAPISACSLWIDDRVGASTATDASGTAWVTRGPGELRVTPHRCCTGAPTTIPRDADSVVLSVERDASTCHSPPPG